LIVKAPNILLKKNDVNIEIKNDILKQDKERKRILSKEMIALKVRSIRRIKEKLKQIPNISPLVPKQSPLLQNVF